MKTATITSLSVYPALRRAAESVLHDGETLHAFMEKSMRAQIDRRLAQQAFLARGLVARDAAEWTGEYYSADQVLRELDNVLQLAQAKAGT